MEENGNATVQINIDNKSICLSGLEDFVERNISLFYDFIKYSKDTASNIDMNLNDKEIVNMETVKQSESHNNIDKSDKDKHKNLGIYSIDPQNGTMLESGDFNHSESL